MGDINKKMYRYIDNKKSKKKKRKKSKIQEKKKDFIIKNLFFLSF